jgi:hypothetical protein
VAGAGRHGRRREREQLLEELRHDLLLLVTRRRVLAAEVQPDHLRQAGVQALRKAHLQHGVSTGTTCRREQGDVRQPDGARRARTFPCERPPR